MGGIDVETAQQILLKRNPFALVFDGARPGANADKGVDSLLKLFGLASRAADQKRNKNEHGDADKTVGHDIGKRGRSVHERRNEESSDWEQKSK